MRDGGLVTIVIAGRRHREPGFPSKDPKGLTRPAEQAVRTWTGMGVWM